MKAKTLILMSLFAVALLQSGCKTKKDRDKEEQDKAQKSAMVESELKQKGIEDRKILQAQRELDDLVRVYQALEGTFRGPYHLVSGRGVDTTVKISVENLPVALDARTPRESDILAARDKLRLRIDHVAVMDGYPDPINNCTKSTTLDIANGTISFDCTTTNANSAGSSTTGFVITLDSDDREFENAVAEKIVQTRGKATALDLAQNKIRTIDALTIKIIERYGEFTGKLRRVRTE